VEQVRALVALIEDPNSCCTEARDIAQAHLGAVRTKLADLRALAREIGAFVERCDTACVGGPGTACVPLAELARGAPAALAPNATRTVTRTVTRPVGRARRAPVRGVATAANGAGLVLAVAFGVLTRWHELQGPLLAIIFLAGGVAVSRPAGGIHDAR
jgi:hypothetical protein